MLVQYSAIQEMFSKQWVDRRHTDIKIPQAKDQQQISSWEEDGSSQGEDRIKATAQQKKYGTSCWEESISMEDKGLAQYSATQEKFSKQRVDTMHTTQQEKHKTGCGKDDSSMR